MSRPANTGPSRLSLRGISALRRAGADGAWAGGGMLREASLELAAERCLALLGDRHAGGSLLLDVVAGHAAASTGVVILQGKEMNARPPAVRRIGMVSPRDPLFPHLDVRDNIGFPLLARGLPVEERTARLDDALALFGLEGVAVRRPASLDRETRIRIALARAIVGEPSLLLLDDPFSRLDPGPRQVLQRMMRRLVTARRLTVLLSTSDRNEALLLGDEIGILEGGRLHQIGPPLLLLDRPDDPVVASRLGDANCLNGQVITAYDDSAMIRLNCGHEMEAEPGGPLACGTSCVLCVRPNQIATAFLSGRVPDAEAGSLPATLVETVHLGDHVRLRFRLKDGTELAVHRPPGALVGEMRTGRAALLAWQPHQARAFAAHAG